MKRFLSALPFLLLACGPRQHSNLGVETLSGWTMDGRQIQLAGVQGPAVVLNFYSPTCQPCIEELPALEQFYEEARKRDVPMFMVLEPDLEKNGVDGVQTDDEAEIRKHLFRRVAEDIKKYQIKIPVLVLSRPFSIKPDGLVTGTPETLLFRTSPFRLYYDFIGPLSTAEDGEGLARSTRYQFALQKLEDLVLKDIYKPREGY